MSLKTSDPAAMRQTTLSCLGTCTRDDPSQYEREGGNNIAYMDLSAKEIKPMASAILVGWENGDLANPRSWSRKYKWWLTIQLSILALTASLGSSIIAPAETSIALMTGVSAEISVLCISLYILGFAVGPLLWAPISEIWGRRWGLLPAMAGLALFSIGTATSRDIQSILVTRLFAGVCGSAPVSNVSAALGDIWAPDERGLAVAFYAVAVVGGPTLGPVIGSAVTVTIGWRWVEYIQAIWTFAIFGLSVVCLPESYSPVLLKVKARRLRKTTGDDRYFHPHEKVKIEPRNLITKHFSRPIAMLLTEPMVSAVALYASFVYGMLYMTLEVFTIVYREHRGWGLLVSNLPFLALFVGVLCAVFINLANQPRYTRISRAAGGKPVPEARLQPMAVGGVLFAVGIWCFAWTADPPVPWAVSAVSAAVFGAGFSVTFNQCVNFLVDTYQLYAASAIAANTILRSVFAAGLPLLASPMFHGLGTGPAMSILGALATIAIPVPFILMKYSAVLRKRSKLASSDC